MKNLPGAFAGTEPVVLICNWGSIDIFFFWEEKENIYRLSVKKGNIPLIHTYIQTYIHFIGTGKYQKKE